MGTRGTDGDDVYVPQGRVGDESQEGKGCGVHAGVHIWEVRQSDVKTMGNGVGGNIPGAEKNLGKSRRVWVFGVSIFPESSHIMVPCNQFIAANGGWYGRRRTNQIRGVLPQSLEIVYFSVLGCPLVAHSAGILPEHFMYGHFCSKVEVLQ